MEVSVPLVASELTLIVKSKGKREDTLRLESASARHLEAEIQLMEGCSYEYELKLEEGATGCYTFSTVGGVIEPITAAPQYGHIKPGNYVGTLQVDLLKDATKVGEVAFEVRSYKSSYREDYRHMLNYITEQCAEIVLQHSSPVIQNLTFDYDADAQTLYQRFAFVRSVIESDEFEESVHRVLTMPVSAWKEREEDIDTRRAGRLGASAVRAFAKGKNRLELPENHSLRAFGIESIPATIPRRKRFETVDTPENRFVLFALTTFQQFCADVGEKLEARGSVREAQHAKAVVERLEEWLSHGMFKEVGRPTTIPLNSPVLQRKEGYREVLRAWLMFDLAAKLVWEAGDDIYSAGKRDVAKLYEYWVFFKLLDVLSHKFKLEHKSIEDLIRKTDDGLSLNLIEGQHTAISGVYERMSRKLRVKFSFNRSFSGERDYPHGGSWTKNMRPDYTLTVWPSEMTEREAEEAELIVHIHFDAKYKIDKVRHWLESDDETEEKQEAVTGSFKREDLLKMHAYKDAIRRTGGAYVLYPGEEGWTREGFHEVLPGLGAFPLRPSSTNDGSKDLVEFIDKVVAHLLDRATQREKASYHNYRIHKDGPSDGLHEPLPEVYGGERAVPVDEVTVLLGMCKSVAHLNWVAVNGLYNTRTGTVSGSIDLGPKVTGATFLVLTVAGNKEIQRMFRIIPFRGREIGPKVYPKQILKNLHYPESFSSDYYCVFALNDNLPKEFVERKWDLQKVLAKHGRIGNQKGVPLAISLKELLSGQSD